MKFDLSVSYEFDDLTLDRAVELMRSLPAIDGASPHGIFLSDHRARDVPPQLLPSEAPVLDSEPEQAPPEPPAVVFGPAEVPSIEQLRAQAQRLVTAGLQPVLKTILAKYRTNSISEIPADKRAEVLAELTATAEGSL